MSLVGLSSVTVATISYLVALTMFFKTDAKLRIVNIASFLMLLFFFASVAVMIIRCFQVLTNRGKLGDCKFYSKNRKRFRIALITLGASCTLFVLMSGMGIFIITSLMSRASGKLVEKSNSMFSRGNDSSNDTLTNSTDSENLRNKNAFQETSLISDNTTVENADTDTRGGRKITPQTRQGTMRNNASNSESESQDTDCKTRLCKSEDVADTENSEDASEEPVVTEPIPEEKQHCKNQTAYPKAKDRQQCRVEGLERVASTFFKKKFIIVAFLAVSFIGHLINTCSALCCNGDPRDPEEEGYEMAAENDCEGEKE